MTQRKFLVTAKEFLKDLSATIFALLGVFAALGFLINGITDFVLRLATDWHAIAASSDVHEMANDMATGMRGTTAYMGNSWPEILTVAGVIAVAYVARQWLVIRPRKKEQNDFALSAPTAKARSTAKKGNPSAEG